VKETKMAQMGSGPGGPNPQVFVLITGAAALLAIPLGLTLSGWDPFSPAPKAGALTATLLPAAASAPAAPDAPSVTVRQLLAHPAVSKPAPPRVAAIRIAGPHATAARRVAQAAPPAAHKTRPHARRVVRVASALRHPAAAPPPVRSVHVSRPEAAERRVYAYAPPEPAPAPATRRERRALEHSRRRESHPARSAETFGAVGNAGFHYGASYDPYSMHIGR
jgi:hypothetical protein